MYHGGGDKVQGVATQGQGVALFYNNAAVGKFTAEELLHHLERLGGCHDLCGGVCLRKRRQRAGMVRLHMLHNEIIRRCFA